MFPDRRDRPRREREEGVEDERHLGDQLAVPGVRRHPRGGPFRGEPGRLAPARRPEEADEVPEGADPRLRRPVGRVLEGVRDPEEEIRDRHLAPRRLRQRRDRESEGAGSSSRGARRGSAMFSGPPRESARGSGRGSRRPRRRAGASRGAKAARPDGAGASARRRRGRPTRRRRGRRRGTPGSSSLGRVGDRAEDQERHATPRRGPGPGGRLHVRDGEGGVGGADARREVALPGGRCQRRRDRDQGRRPRPEARARAPEGRRRGRAPRRTRRGSASRPRRVARAEGTARALPPRRRRRGTRPGIPPSRNWRRRRPASRRRRSCPAGRTPASSSEKKTSGGPSLGPAPAAGDGFATPSNSSGIAVTMATTPPGALRELGVFRPQPGSTANIAVLPEPGAGARERVLDGCCGRPSSRTAFAAEKNIRCRDIRTLSREMDGSRPGAARGRCRPRPRRAGWRAGASRAAPGGR